MKEFMLGVILLGFLGVMSNMLYYKWTNRNKIQKVWRDNWYHSDKGDK